MMLAISTACGLLICLAVKVCSLTATPRSSKCFLISSCCFRMPAVPLMRGPMAQMSSRYFMVRLPSMAIGWAGRCPPGRSPAKPGSLSCSFTALGPSRSPANGSRGGFFGASPTCTSSMPNRGSRKNADASVIPTNRDMVKLLTPGPSWDIAAAGALSLIRGRRETVQTGLTRAADDVPVRIDLFAQNLQLVLVRRRRDHQRLADAQLETGRLPHLLQRDAWMEAEDLHALCGFVIAHD